MFGNNIHTKKQIRSAFHFQKVIIIALDKNFLFNNWSQGQLMQKVYKLAVKFSYFIALKGAIVCHEADVDPTSFHCLMEIEKTLQVENILSQRQNLKTIL